MLFRSLVTSDSADFLYKCTELYSPGDEKTLMWNDPKLRIEWPLPSGAAPLLSAKDEKGQPFQALEKFP